MPLNFDCEASTMRQCRYLTGENIAPKTAKEAKALIGKHVEYLQTRDIDRSGRGYIFPRYGTVTGVLRRDMDMDNNLSFDVSMSNLVEMRLMDPPVQSTNAECSESNDSR